MSVSIVDFTPFHHGTELEHAQLSTAIAQELRKNGAVRLVNHGIPAETISKCYEWVSSTCIHPPWRIIYASKKRALLMSNLAHAE